MNTAAIKVLIAEDERPLREALVEQITRLWPDAQIVAVCRDGDEALALFSREQPQVAFLDIRMPGHSGLEVAAAIGDQAFVVFTTAYDEYAIAAFESGAVDYLLKPIDDTRMRACVTRLKDRIASQTPVDLTDMLQALQARMAGQTETLRWVTASIGDSVKMISVDDIVYFQAEHKLTKVVTKEFLAFIRVPIKELRTRLDPAMFLQIHRGVIVSKAEVESLRKDELGHWHCHLRTRDERLPVSQKYKRLLHGM